MEDAQMLHLMSAFMILKNINYFPNPFYDWEDLLRQNGVADNVVIEMAGKCASRNRALRHAFNSPKGVSANVAKILQTLPKHPLKTDPAKFIRNKHKPTLLLTEQPIQSPLWTDQVTFHSEESNSPIGNNIFPVPTTSTPMSRNEFLERGEANKYAHDVNAEVLQHDLNFELNMEESLDGATPNVTTIDITTEMNKNFIEISILEAHVLNLRTQITTVEQKMKQLQQRNQYLLPTLSMLMSDMKQ